MLRTKSSDLQCRCTRDYHMTIREGPVDHRVCAYNRMIAERDSRQDHRSKSDPTRAADPDPLGRRREIEVIEVVILRNNADIRTPYSPSSNMETIGSIDVASTADRQTPPDIGAFILNTQFFGMKNSGCEMLAIATIAIETHQTLSKSIDGPQCNASARNIAGREFRQ